MRINEAVRLNFNESARVKVFKQNIWSNKCENTRVKSLMFEHKQFTGIEKKKNQNKNKQ